MPLAHPIRHLLPEVKFLNPAAPPDAGANHAPRVHEAHGGPFRVIAMWRSLPYSAPL